jgi:hypothetical protein
MRLAEEEEPEDRVSLGSSLNPLQRLALLCRSIKEAVAPSFLDELQSEIEWERRRPAGPNGLSLRALPVS